MFAVQSNDSEHDSFSSRSSPPATQTDPSLVDNPEYLSQLLKDKRQLAAVPNMFMHLERLLDQGQCDEFLSFVEEVTLVSSG